MRSAVVACVGALSMAAGALGVNVLIISSENPTIDTAVEEALEAGGHDATLGPSYHAFTEGFDLEGYDVIYLQINYNYSSPDMSPGGQAALLDFVEAGGGLVTCEWTVWKAYAQGQLVEMRVALPGLYYGYGASGTATYSLSTPDATLGAGLPNSFDFPLDSYGGTETVLRPKCGATEYYSSASDSGVLGWNFGIGRVLSFSTTNGPTQIADKNFARLLSNSMDWAAMAGGPPPDPAYADCDDSGLLDLFDFLCFTNLFNAGDEAADCDGDGGLGLFDFLCFVNAFNAGC